MFVHILQLLQVLEYWQKKMQQATGYRWDESDILGVTKCLEIAMSSVHSERDNRPSTTKIVDDLEKLDAQIEEILKKDPKPLIGVVPYEKLTGPVIQPFIYFRLKYKLLVEPYFRLTLCML